MKKTLIALAVAASAVVSSSAMAWEANSNGGSVDLSGTLTRVDNTPWEVQVGTAVNGLDATFERGQQVINVTVNDPIPVLGIRTVEENGVFEGKAGISPQINYHDAVNLDGFDAGNAPLTLEVKDADDMKIGTVETSLSAAALVSYSKGETLNKVSAFASVDGKGFYGGLPKTAETVTADPISFTTPFFPEASAHFSPQGAASITGNGETSFAVEGGSYSAFYASGIAAGKALKITLDEPAASDNITWKASLPVTVSYQ